MCTRCGGFRALRLFVSRGNRQDESFSHTQKQENGAVEGSYKVQLPDGRTQIVKYIADSNGYRADVSYQDKNGDIVPTPSPANYQHGSAYHQVESTVGSYLEKPTISYYKKAVPTSPLYLVSTPYPPRQHYNDINVQPRQPIVDST